MMTESARLEKMYQENDTLTVRIGLHDKYSVNKYGFGNWIFDQYVFSANMKILELGCGTGRIWENRDNRIPSNSQIVISDTSSLMVRKAEDLLKGNPAFTFRQIDIQDIPYCDDYFDMVIANYMLHHVPNKELALSEIRRVLKTNASFYVSTTGHTSLKELNDVYSKLEGKASFYYNKDISFSLENGFDLLTEFFSKVEKRQYIDSLEVTDIEELISYVKSYNDIPESVSDDLYRLVSERFIDGVFKIRKEQGIFICTK